MAVPIDIHEAKVEIGIDYAVKIECESQCRRHRKAFETVIMKNTSDVCATKTAAALHWK